jgi:hypothetical protein
MSKEWIETLADGRLEIDLTELVISCPKYGRFRGSGRIEWSATDGVRLRAITDNSKALIDTAFDQLSDKPGTVVPEDEYAELRGTTQSEKIVTARSFYA